MLAPITHKGIIENVAPGGIARVRLTDISADDCSGCRIATLCRRGGEVVVDARIAAAVEASAGSRVEVEAAGGISRRAVALLLLLPLGVLVMAVAVVALAGGSEGAAVSVGLGALALTFFVLYSLRSRLDSAPGWVVVNVLK